MNINSKVSLIMIPSHRSSCIFHIFSENLLQKLTRFRPISARYFSYYTKEDDLFDDESFPAERSQRWSKYGNNRNFNRNERSSYTNHFVLRKPDWENKTLQPIEKNSYVPTDIVVNQTEEEILSFRKLHNMTLRGNNIPAPIQQFSDYNFNPELNNYFLKKEFKAPTPIQAQGWPIALSGRDFIGIGQTGSGKTLGFVFPALIHISHQIPVCRGDGPIVLVMAPTRELAQQTEKIANELKKNITVCVYGGAEKNPQRNRLLNGPSIVVATPGRLLDFLETGVTNLRRCSFLVLDEADRMLDMGFEPQIRKVIEQTRPDRQTLMWSATWPKEIRNLAEDFLDDYIQLNIGSMQLKANSNIKQEFFFCSKYEKLDRFVENMQKMSTENSSSRILIFAETKKNVDFVERILNKNRISAQGIHGDHSQASRDRTLYGFRTGKFNVLVATNVAARGLDVDNISHVINYDFPNCIEDYVHRIGRTARGDNEGISVSYMTEENSDMAKDLIKILKESSQIIPEELNSLVSNQPRRDTRFKKHSKPYGSSYGNMNRRSQYYN